MKKDEKKESGGFRHKKSLGQHFLNNTRVPAYMADAGHVTAGDIVLEIGPGTGVLTDELLRRGARVIGVETDDRAITVLQEKFGEEIRKRQLSIVRKDMRTCAVSEFGLAEHQYKVVANIPYYLSGMLFRMFLESDRQPAELVFLVQKEVATRIARDKKESLLSLSVKAYGTPVYVRTVRKGNFTPQPKIDSAILSVGGISHKRFTGVEERLFFELLHAGFASKRKQLLGNLSKTLDRGVLINIFSTCSLPLSTRAEDLTIEMWLDLVREIQVHR